MEGLGLLDPVAGGWRACAAVPLWNCPVTACREPYLGLRGIRGVLQRLCQPLHVAIDLIDRVSLLRYQPETFVQLWVLKHP